MFKQPEPRPLDRPAPAAPSPSSAPPAPTAAAPPIAPMADRRLVAWIGAAVKIEGKVTSALDLTIDGEVEGEIEVGGHNLTIGAGAVVRADVVGKTVTISGTVIGNVTA